jgi:type I restriction enzyme, S subunit
MELTKTKFKKTEVGLIPEDWEVGPLENYFSYISYGFTNPMPTATIGKYLITAKDIIQGKINYVTARKTPDWAYKKLITDKSRPKKGDLLLTKDGTLGRLAIVETDDICINQSVAVIRTNFRVDVVFLQKLLESNYYQRVMLENAGGSTIKHIYITIVNKMAIGAPQNLTEQKAIATALSDVDELIANLEKLIEKKKAIKQGAMQQLLTPNENWREVNFTEIVHHVHGKAHEQHIVESGQFTVVNSKFVSTQGKVAKYSDVNFCPALKNDILTVLSDLPSGKALAKCFFVETSKKYAVNQRVCIWRTKGSDPRFLFYLLNRHKYFLSLDDGVSQTHILNHHIEKFRLKIPIELSAQKNIGQVLFDTDSEINQLELILEKKKRIKQGMMQELLTGRTRLV